MKENLGIAVTYVPYPDLASFYVGLRNGNCDFAVGAVELDPQRAACPASCPDPSTALLPVLSEEDYVTDPVPYQLRLAQDICCLEYSSSYYMSGFALMSRLKRNRISVLDAIFSMEILNVAMPVLCGLISFGTLMWLLERRTNPAFKNQTAGVYYAFVSLSTFGFGDLAPATTPGRLLTIFWTIFSVFSLTAFGGTISSKLTVAQLSVTTIDSLSQVTPAEICIEANYLLVNRLIAETYSLSLDDRGRVNAPGSIMTGSLASCVQAVLDGTVKAYVTDGPLLQWLAYEYLDEQDLYVSPVVRKNPLAWAFPKGSPVRPVLDAAIMKMLINGTWLAQYEPIIATWFPTAIGSAEPDPNNDLLVGPFVAAMVLTGTWLLGLAGEEGWKAYNARAGASKQADAEACANGAKAGVNGAALPPEHRIAEALAQEAAAAAAAAQAASDRAAELLAALAAARAPARASELAAAPVEAF